ncbi:energy-coupling factor ABC transporter ATP-binding protein [Enterovirga rhinocerotis]|uniref:Biotin transport system ATP-binding protein n=1 Tax=Enterovirga rhinocerotis TaxID=1339210 RepID=A0A4R7BR50_9HYPH|nr:ABC transporter ATP-binding protein [Enterovirga rhinocerotis]TDR87252.1 biotin transport system ATP-binding protein [Enterovirga rhinocerotis]
MIRFDEVSVTRGERRVLAEVSCVLPERRIAILGPNGSGKSTFVRLINGLVVPSAGRLDVDGLDPAADPKAVRRRVGFVFQNPDNQIVFPIVEEDIAFGLRNLGRSRMEAAEASRAALDGFGLGHLAAQPVATLSGGEKQLVALLGVLVMQPAILVFDEPTTLLDLRNRNRIAAAIGGLDQQAIVVTHDLDLVAGFDRALVLDGGRIVADDEPGAAIAWYRERMA